MIDSPPGSWYDPCAPWWYLTSPVPPWGRVVIGSSVEEPSNSAKIDS